MPPPPAFVAIGHLTRDRQIDGSDRPGGSVLYAAVTAERLGLSAAVVTAAESVAFAEKAFAETNVLVSCRAVGVTTTFQNRYEGDTRRQRLLAVASPLGQADVPIDWRRAPFVQLAPVADEVDPTIADLFPDALVVATAQGWLRRRMSHGLVQPAPRPIPALILQRADAIAVSDEDLGPTLAHLADYIQKTRMLVVTHGAAGATLYVGGQQLQIPGFPAKTVDPTGAGDVFAAALLVRLGDGAPPIEAARFASAAASCSVEAPGIRGIPTRAEVIRRLSTESEEVTHRG